MKFSILAERSPLDVKTFVYDNETNTLSDAAGKVYEYPQFSKDHKHTAECQHVKTEPAATVFSKADPLKKSKQVRTLKIQMGLSCNYACTYCSQRFVEPSEETSSKHIDRFMTLLDRLEFSDKDGLKIEFWGGEPLVYWKTMKPLAEALRARFAGWQRLPVMSVITNGSLLTQEINDWLVLMGFAVGISHDGPGQHVRGPDPLDDPEVRRCILDLYKRLRPINRISFNCMLNAQNTSRKAIFDYFVELTGDAFVSLGEGGLIDAYDDDAVKVSLSTLDEHFAFRKMAYNDIDSTGGRIGFGGVLEKIDGFTRSILTHRAADTVAQKCGMDDPHTVAVDLRGNVITCQNVSAVATANNGAPHLGGNILAIDKVRLRSATHWRNRKDCASCPVLHLCRGSCMYLEDGYWETSCDNAYSDAVPLFALSIKQITKGYTPILIDGQHLPLDRQDIWGTVHHSSEQKTQEAVT